MSTNALNKFALDVCVVPITHVEHKQFRVRPRIKAVDGGLDVDSWAKCDQVTTIEKSLLVRPALGTLQDPTMQAIEKSVKTSLKLP